LLLVASLGACAEPAVQRTAASSGSPGPVAPATAPAPAPSPALPGPAESADDIPPIVVPRNVPLRFGHRRDDFARSRALIEALPDGGFYFRASDYGAVRHLPSGMLCEIYEDRRAISLERLVLYPGAPPGDDAGCEYATSSDGRLILRARRAGPASLAEVEAAMIAAIEHDHPGAKALQEQEINAGPAIMHSFILAGRREMESIWLAQEGDWILSAEATYPTTARSDAVLQAAMAFLFAQTGARVGCGPDASWLEGTKCPG
jgi:hypothetical protein